MAKQRVCTDWVDRPQNCKDLYLNFATFARLPFGHISPENSEFSGEI